jgi:formate hydrogenlyase subunit 6/NADH:ubiquinone oxidoreductase subunit I
VANKLRLPRMIREIASSLLKSPFTREYPKVKVGVPEGFRGRHILYPERCISCGLCERDCPANAIKLVETADKRLPVFHLDLCIFCFQCADSCPRSAIEPSTLFEMSSTKKEELILKPKALISSYKNVFKGDDKK